MSFAVMIVEDSESKMNSIIGVLEREIPMVQISTAQSVKSAIEGLKGIMPNLIIADMSLPTFDIGARERGGTPRPFGGIEVFETLERNEFRIPVVVVSSYPTFIEGNQAVGLAELSKRLQHEFPELFVGTVYFDSAYSTWEQEMITLIKPTLDKK